MNEQDERHYLNGEATILLKHAEQSLGELMTAISDVETEKLKSLVDDIVDMRERHFDRIQETS